MKTEAVRELLRLNKLPTIWCPGCGHGIILSSLLRAIVKTGWRKDEIALISGIGCAGRIPGYVDFNTLHTTHGRALTFATGIKLAKPGMKVVVVSGDGDGAAIGGNHFVHACRRNIDMTIVLFNNGIYGMTGGQVSPTTPYGYRTSTAPYGQLEKPFDIVNLALGAGATYVARGSVYHVPMLDKLIYDGLMHKGFSVIDVITTCPTTFGRRNKLTDDGVKNLEWVKGMVVTGSAAKKLTPEELEGKYVIGVFRKDETKKDLNTLYAELEQKARRK